MMHLIKTLFVDPGELQRYNALMRHSFDYDKQGVKSFETVQSWTVKFPKSVEMDIKVCAGSANDKDPLWAEGVLFRMGSELNHTEVEDRLDTDFECSWSDKKRKYTVDVKPAGVHVENPVRFVAQRNIPMEKYKTYKTLLPERLDETLIKKQATAFVMSSWEVYFPHNYVMHVQVCSENNQLYTRAIMTRKNKRKNKPVYTKPMNSLDEPFEIKCDKILYRVELVPTEKLIREEKPDEE